MPQTLNTKHVLANQLCLWKVGNCVHCVRWTCLYVVCPRNHSFRSYTPSGQNGLSYTSRYGWVGLSIVEDLFIAEGLNEKGLSAGFFYFHGCGAYHPYDPQHNEKTLSDMQFVSWMLSLFATVDEVKEAVKEIRLAGIFPPEEGNSTFHYRLADASGKQVVIEIFNNGEIHFYDNIAGVITNSPGYEWHIANLNNYMNLRPGSVANHKLGNVALFPYGSGSAMMGLPGDITPTSRLFRIAFYQATAPVQQHVLDTITQCFHILNNFDILIGIVHETDYKNELPSATQRTSVIDLTSRSIYYRTAYNCNIRKIDLSKIDFFAIRYQSHPLDPELKQPIEEISIG